MLPTKSIYASHVLKNVLQNNADPTYGQVRLTQTDVANYYNLQVILYMSLSTKSPQQIWEEIINNDTDLNETPEKKIDRFSPKKVPKPKLHKVKRNPSNQTTYLISPFLGNIP